RWLRRFPTPNEDTTVNIPWDQIIELALQLIEQCMEPTPAAIRNPGALQRIRLERGVKDKVGLDRKQWRQQRDQIMSEVYAQLAAASDEDLNYLIDCCKAE